MIQTFRGHVFINDRKLLLKLGMTSFQSLSEINDNSVITCIEIYSLYLASAAVSFSSDSKCAESLFTRPLLLAPAAEGDLIRG